MCGNRLFCWAILWSPRDSWGLSWKPDIFSQMLALFHCLPAKSKFHFVLFYSLMLWTVCVLKIHALHPDVKLTLITGKYEMVATLEAWLILSWSSILWHKQIFFIFFYWLEAFKCLNAVFRPFISQQFNLMQGYSLKNMHYLCVRNYCMIILSSITRTILTLSSNPEPHLHNENGLQALNDLTNIMWPCVSAGDPPQDGESGHANPAMAEIFSCSTVHSLRDKLWTLPLLLKLSHCSILSHIYKSVCIPTMKQTGDSCIATVPGRGREQREKQSGSRNGPVWATARDLEWVPNCRAASGKGHNQENKSVQ